MRAVSVGFSGTQRHGRRGHRRSVGRPVAAANASRSFGSNRGRLICRRSTATSCRSTSSSTSFTASPRPRSTTRPSTARRTAYTTEKITPNDHAEPRSDTRTEVLEPHTLDAEGRPWQRPGFEASVQWERSMGEDLRSTTQAASPPRFRAMITPTSRQVGVGMRWSEWYFAAKRACVGRANWVQNKLRERMDGVAAAIC
jgi:hypothetical protein